MGIPEWVQDSVFYQIFPDRFANGDPSNDPPNVQPWGSLPTTYGFQGGDLRGMIQRIDYLLDLGITAIYLNPIFKATSNHRYNTTDPYCIDPRLGSMEDFRELLDLAHRHGMRVILDGVFNHCGRGFFAFQDLLENESHSAYRDWFHVRRLPLDAYGPGKAEAYVAWWGIRSLPKFNTRNPDARRYLLDVGRYWIEQGADGWRLDVPNEIDDDSFWAEFREGVKAANPEAYLLGEIWEVDPRWVGPGQFDGLMNYPVRQALVGLVADGSLTVSAFDRRMREALAAYPPEHGRAHYVPLGSHDTERVRMLCGGDVKKVRLMALLQFALPGAPAIYYGDEIGLEGGKDPDSRRAFPWQESEWEGGLREHYRALIRVRRQEVVLRRGSYLSLLVDDADRAYAFARRAGDGSVAVVLNASTHPRHVEVPVGPLGWQDGEVATELLGGGHASIVGGKVRVDLDAHEGAWLAVRRG
jgi:cyclomaltodextrinase